MTYKNHNTAKAMVAITSSGVVCFFSKLYGGLITDRELFIETGIIDKMDVGDAVMADKGSTVADILNLRGMTLNIPPRKNSDQFTEQELVETR